MTNVLMIAYAFPPDNGPGVARPLHFAKHLGEFGYHPLVLTQQGFSDYPVDATVMPELAGRCDILRVTPSWLGKLGGRAGREMEWMAKTTAAGLRAAAGTGYDLIWVTAPPWTAFYPAYFLSRVTGRPLVVDMRDPWTYGYMWYARSRLRRRLDPWVERTVLTRAARAVFTSPLTTSIMQARLGPRVGRRMVTITNGFAEGAIEPVRDAPAEKCLFRFVGSLSHRNKRPDVLFRGLRMACRDPGFAADARVQFIGAMDGFENALDGYGLSGNVEYLGYVSAERSREYMAGADVLILLQVVAGASSDVISGKHFEYLASRRPTLGIVPEGSGDAWLLGQMASGIITGVEDNRRIAEGFLHYWRLWKDGKLAGPATDADIRRFSRRALTSRLAGVFDEVLAARRAASL